MALKISPSFSELNLSSSFVKIYELFPFPVSIKLEGWNMAGSIKLKPALEMIYHLEERKIIGSHTHLIESSSGNLGIALSLISAERNYSFTCVTDPNTSVDAINFMKALGAHVIVVTQRDKNGGYLSTRIEKIKEICSLNPSFVWVNQYANLNNPQAHFSTTAPEILKRFDHIDYLFIGAGTTGTLMGCAHFFRIYSPHTKIIAVDVEGSVTFNHLSKKRHIPGLGTSRRPEILDENFMSDHVLVSETKTVEMCRILAKKGFLCGGSTGSVLAGINSYRNKISRHQTVVTISPDFGFKYLRTLYDDTWVSENISPSPLD